MLLSIIGTIGIMASQPFTKIDLSQWETEKSYPVNIRIDNDPSSADLQLEGVLETNDSYLYSFILQPGLAYRFDMRTPFAETHAFLTLSGTPDVLWANTTALSTISADRMQAIDVTVDIPTEVTLTVFNPTDQPKVSFSFAAFTKEGSTEVPIVVEPPTPPTPPTLPTPDNIVRFTQLSTGNYLYTASPSEQDLLLSGSFPDFRSDGAVFSGDNEPREGYIPVYRFFVLSTASHFFTANEQERAALENTPGFVLEQFKFFVPSPGTEETIPVYRLQNVDTGAQLLTVNPVEKAYALLSGDWVDQDIAFQAFPVLDTPVTPAEQLEVQVVGLAVEHLG